MPSVQLLPNLNCVHLQVSYRSLRLKASDEDVVVTAAYGSAISMCMPMNCGRKYPD